MGLLRDWLLVWHAFCPFGTSKDRDCYLCLLILYIPSLYIYIYLGYKYITTMLHNIIFPLIGTPTIPHPIYCSGFFPETNTWKTCKFPHLFSQPGRPVSPALQKSPQQRMERSTKDRAAGNPCMFQVNDPCKNANFPHIFRNMLQC